MRFLPVLLIGATLCASAAPQKIEQRLQKLEDREQIRELLAEYIRCLDTRDHATYSQLFAQDGELTFAPRATRLVPRRSAR